MRLVSTISSDLVILCVIGGPGNLEGNQFLTTILVAVIRRT